MDIARPDALAAMIREQVSQPPDLCHWYLNCTNTATHDRPFGNGTVPCCDECGRIGV